MQKKLRKVIRLILEKEYIKESIEESQKKRLVSILNSLEFKDDILQAGGEIYAVGGIVRDAIMNKPSDDLDIVVRGVPYDELYSILSKHGKATDTSHEKEEGDKDFGSTKFVSSNPEYIEYLASNGVARDIDVMLPRKDAKDPNIKGHKGIKSDVNPMYSIEDDLDRRDITINAIAMDLDGNLISKGTGLDDIKNGVIKAVSEDAFIEDPLRMLRAVRFNARYNYSWDGATIDLIKQNVHLLSDKSELPKERFLMEFEKMIGKSDLGKAVKLLVDLGMYEAIFGVKSKINNFDKFKKANNVGEMGYMMFEEQPSELIIPLIEDNITNNKEYVSYAEVLNSYQKLLYSNLSLGDKIYELSLLYNKNKNALLESSYINKEDVNIAKLFDSGRLPIDKKGVNLKGGEIVDIIKNSDGKEFKRSIGNAQELALKAIYNGEIINKPDSIRSLLFDKAEEWMED
jgi:tRNA nucleotidyltransferase (CCA-adding enzyme)